MAPANPAKFFGIVHSRTYVSLSIVIKEWTFLNSISTNERLSFDLRFGQANVVFIWSLGMVRQGVCGLACSAIAAGHLLLAVFAVAVYSSPNT